MHWSYVFLVLTQQYVCVNNLDLCHTNSLSCCVSFCHKMCITVAITEKSHSLPWRWISDKRINLYRALSCGHLFCFSAQIFIAMRDLLCMVMNLLYNHVHGENIWGKIGMICFFLESFFLQSTRIYTKVVPYLWYVNTFSSYNLVQNGQDAKHCIFILNVCIFQYNVNQFWYFRHKTWCKELIYTYLGYF